MTWSFCSGQILKSGAGGPSSPAADGPPARRRCTRLRIMDPRGRTSLSCGRSCSHRTPLQCLRPGTAALVPDLLRRTFNAFWLKLPTPSPPGVLRASDPRASAPIRLSLAPCADPGSQSAQACRTPEPCASAAQWTVAPFGAPKPSVELPTSTSCWLRQAGLQSRLHSVPARRRNGALSGAFLLLLEPKVAGVSMMLAERVAREVEPQVSLRGRPSRQVPVNPLRRPCLACSRTRRFVVPRRRT